MTNSVACPPNSSHVAVVKTSRKRRTRLLGIGTPNSSVKLGIGTGKSTLIHWLRSQLDSCAVIAPTAVAAANIQGDTIHSFFGLPPRLIDPAEKHPTTTKVRLVLENINCLVVDEVSMVLPNLVDTMSNILCSARANDLPFGGVPVIFVGDLLQLPPVVSTPEESVYFSHRYPTPHFFSADIFKKQQIVPVVLTKVRRQADETFIDALNRIRLNDTCRDAVALFNRCCYRDKPTGSSTGVYLVPTNQAARTINMRELDKLAEPVRLYEAEISGNVAANRWKLPVPDRLELKVGAKVIFLKNRKPSRANCFLKWRNLREQRDLFWPIADIAAAGPAELMLMAACDPKRPSGNVHPAPPSQPQRQPHAPVAR